MARPLRLDFAGAVWHLTSRGNGGHSIFDCDDDRLDFLALLAEAKRRFKWLIYTYTLMTNHFHLVIETPEGTLSRGMQWLLAPVISIADTSARAICSRLKFPKAEGNNLH